MTLNIVDEDAAAETREKFVEDIHLIEQNFVNRLTQFQTEVSAAVMTIKRALDKQKVANEVTTVQSFEAPVVEGPVLTRPQTVPERGGLPRDRKVIKKSTTMSSVDSMDRPVGGTVVSVEISEIIGLTFPSRTLDSIMCFVKSPLGTSQITNAHVMIQDHAPSLVLFDPVQIIVNSDYQEVRDSNDIITVQIARDAAQQGARFVGKVQFSLSELTAEPHQRLEKSFVAEVLGTMSKGTLVINTSTREALPFEA